MRSLFLEANAAARASIVISSEWDTHHILHELESRTLIAASFQIVLCCNLRPSLAVLIHPLHYIEWMIPCLGWLSLEAEVSTNRRPNLFPSRSWSINYVESSFVGLFWMHAGMHMEPSKNVLRRICVQRCPGLRASWKWDFSTFTVELLVQAEEDADTLSNVHGIVVRNEANNSVWPDFAELPRFAFGSLLDDVVLCIVENIACPWLRYPW